MLHGVWRGPDWTPWGRPCLSESGNEEAEARSAVKWAVQIDPRVSRVAEPNEAIVVSESDAHFSVGCDQAHPLVVDAGMGWVLGGCTGVDCNV